MTKASPKPAADAAAYEAKWQAEQKRAFDEAPELVRLTIRYYSHLRSTLRAVDDTNVAYTDSRSHLMLCATLLAVADRQQAAVSGGLS